MPQESKDSKTRDTGRAGGSGRAEREERLATALRENLRKRKAQQRGRGESGGPRGPDGEKPEDAGERG